MPDVPTAAAANAGSSPVLEVEGLSVSYGGRRQALDDVSFRIGPGEFVGLLGPNGAGKSTLFQILTGLLAPDAGTVRLFGLDYRHDAPRILQRLGVVFQARSVDLELTVDENLRFHGGLFGLGGADLRQRVDTALGLVDLVALRSRLVRTLSGGEQRRVEVARALLNAPQLLLTDEPSTGLDPAARPGLVAHVQALVRRDNMAALWATHLVDEVEAADRILVLHDGRLVAAGARAELLAQAGADNLTQAYMRLTDRTEGSFSAATPRMETV